MATNSGNTTRDVKIAIFLIIVVGGGFIVYKYWPYIKAAMELAGAAGIAYALAGLIGIIADICGAVIGVGGGALQFGSWLYQKTFAQKMENGEEVTEENAKGMLDSAEEGTDTATEVTGINPQASSFSLTAENGASTVVENTALEGEKADIGGTVGEVLENLGVQAIEKGVEGELIE